MPIPGTVPLGGRIAPTSTLDTYPTHEDKYGKGGYRPVVTVAERDAIPTERRKAGMMVFVTGTTQFFTLNADLSTWTQRFVSPTTPVTPAPVVSPTTNILELDTTGLLGILTQQTVGGYVSQFQPTGWTVKAIEYYYSKLDPATPATKTFRKRYVVGVDFAIGDKINYSLDTIPGAPLWVYWVGIVTQDSNSTVEIEIPLIPIFYLTHGSPLPTAAPLTMLGPAVSDTDNGALFATATDGTNTIYLRTGSGVYLGAGYLTAKHSVAAASFVVPSAMVATQTPINFGFRRVVAYAPKGPLDLRIGSHIYLSLGSPLVDGKRATATSFNEPYNGPLGAYSTILGQEVDSQGIGKWSVVLDPNRENEAIHVNQVGYQVGHKKSAMVGLFLGAVGEKASGNYPHAPKAGELNVTGYSDYEIVDALTYSVVYTGKLKWRKDQFWPKGADGEPHYYQQIKTADFTAFDNVGYYRVRVNGLGCSYPFSISPLAFLAYLRLSLRGVYQYRCGVELTRPYTRQTHVACHTENVQIPIPSSSVAFAQTWAMIQSNSGAPSYQLAPQPLDEFRLVMPYGDTGPKTITGGHHDAGDFGRYTNTVALMIHHLVFAADMWGGNFDNLGIPESGDGKSDLLAEAKIDADFLLAMQDQKTKFFYTLLRPLTRPYDDDQDLQTSQTSGDLMAAWPCSSVASAAAVAALAQIGGSPLFRAQYGTTIADTYLNAAKAGWAALIDLFASLDPNGKAYAFQLVWHYSVDSSHDDELAWAATELYLATGDIQYHDWLLHTPTDTTSLPFDPTSTSFMKWRWWPMFESVGCAARSYALSARTGRVQPLDSNYLALCETAISTAANYRLANVEGSCYGDGLPKDFKVNIDASWIWSAQQSFDLAAGYELETDPALKARYIAAYAEAFGAFYGCNALNMCFASNCGLRSRRDVVSQMAQLTKAERTLPPTGWFTGEFGKLAGYANLGKYKNSLKKMMFPELDTPGNENDTWLRDRHTDQFDIAREITIWEASAIVAGATFLASKIPGASDQVYTGLTGVIDGIPDSTDQFTPLAGILSCPGMTNDELDEARIVWENKGIAEPFQGGVTTSYVKGRVLSYVASTGGITWMEAEAHMPDGRIVIARKNYSARFSATRDIRDFIDPKDPNITAWWKFDADLDDSIAPGTGRALYPSFTSQVVLDISSFVYPKNPGGGSLRCVFSLGNRATATVPSSIVVAPGQIGFSIQFMLFINAWMTQVIAGNHSVIIFGNNFSKRIELRDTQYRAGRSFQGNSGLALLTNLDFNNLFSLKVWNNIRIETTTTGQKVFINGIPVGTGLTGNMFSAWSNPAGTLILDVGDFDGWIDDIVVKIMK